MNINKRISINTSSAFASNYKPKPLCHFLRNDLLTIPEFRYDHRKILTKNYIISDILKFPKDLFNIVITELFPLQPTSFDYEKVVNGTFKSIAIYCINMNRYLKDNWLDRIYYDIKNFMYSNIKGSNYLAGFIIYTEFLHATEAVTNIMHYLLKKNNCTNEDILKKIYPVPLYNDFESSDGNKLIEYEYLYKNSIYIVLFGVLEEFRRQGISTFLLEQVKYQVALLNKPFIVLHTTDYNTAAINCYKKAGFKIIDEIPYYYFFLKTNSHHQGYLFIYENPLFSDSYFDKLIELAKLKYENAVVQFNS